MDYDAKMGEYKKTLKDNEKPKKPMTAYMLFSNSNRAEIKEAHPGNSRGIFVIYRYHYY